MQKIPRLHSVARNTGADNALADLGLPKPPKPPTPTVPKVPKIAPMKTQGPLTSGTSINKKPL